MCTESWYKKVSFIEASYPINQARQKYSDTKKGLESTPNAGRCIGVPTLPTRPNARPTLHMSHIVSQRQMRLRCIFFASAKTWNGKLLVVYISEQRELFIQQAIVEVTHARMQFNPAEDQECESSARSMHADIKTYHFCNWPRCELCSGNQIILQQGWENVSRN